MEKTTGKENETVLVDFLDYATLFSSKKYISACKKFYGKILSEREINLGDPNIFWLGEYGNLEVNVRFRVTYFSKTPKDFSDNSIAKTFFEMVRPLSKVGCYVKSDTSPYNDKFEMNLLEDRVKVFIFNITKDPRSIAFNSMQKNRADWKTTPKNFYNFLTSVENAFSFSGRTSQLRTDAVISYIHQEKEIGGFKLLSGDGKKDQTIIFFNK